MNIRNELPLEQQFELQVFEKRVQQLSAEEAKSLLVKIQENMLYQKLTFQSILKEAWGIGDSVDLSLELLAEE